MPTLTQSGPRLIEALPCTLQPNAVLLAAPASDRRLSLLASGVVYAAIACSLAVLARERRVFLPFQGHGREVIFDDSVPARPVVPPAPQQVAGNGQRPPGAEITQRPAVTDQVPVITPTGLPTTDRSHAGQFTADMPVAKDGTGALTPPVPVAIQPAPPAAPVEVKELRVLAQVQPVYPALALRARIHGPVVLRMTVDAQGVPSEVQVEGGPHPSLCAEALRVARLWRFEPARVDGRAVAAQFHLTVVFRLAS